MALLGLALVCVRAPSLLDPLSSAFNGAARGLYSCQHWAGVWPISLTFVGLMLFALANVGGRATAMATLPAGIVGAIGASLALVLTSGSTGAWTYAWTLALVALGLGLAARGMWSGRPEVTRTGGHLIHVGGALFTAFGIAIESAFGLAGLSGSLVVPLLLQVVAIGVSVLVLGRHLQYRQL